MKKNWHDHRISLSCRNPAQTPTSEPQDVQNIPMDIDEIILTFQNSQNYNFACGSVWV
jgi:hypothetical protein